MILISACFANVNCRYDGKNKPIEWIEALYKEGRAIPVCPEVLGGLPIPRPSCEIVSLEGHRVVVDRTGVDRTAAFVLGADRTLAIAQACGAKLAILKANSPSCGHNAVYDGTFSGVSVAGDGFATALLIKHGIRVFNENEEEAFRQALQAML